MSLKSRFGLLERRRPTRELPASPLEQRFGTLGETRRAEPPPPAATVPVREELSAASDAATRAGTVLDAPRREPDDWKDRLIAVLLVGWAGPRLIEAVGRLVAAGLALVLLVVLLATGVFRQGCAVMTGDYASDDPAGVRR